MHHTIFISIIFDMVLKRERAKQRKAAAAAKSTTTSNNTEVVGSGIRQDSRRIIKALNKFPTTRIVELVERGDGVTLQLHYLNQKSKGFHIRRVVCCQLCLDC